MITKINKQIYLTETAESLTLVIFPKLKPIVKYIYNITIIGMIGMFFLFLYHTLLENSIIPGVLCLLCIFVGIRYIKIVSSKEIISIDRIAISITQKDFIETKFVSYLITDISNLRYVGENEFTPHSIGQSDFDYLGIQTNEKELQNLIKDGTLEFFYQGKRIRFGMDVYSWDAEKIIARIGKFSGINLQMNDAMEQLLKELKEKGDEDNGL